MSESNNFRVVINLSNFFSDHRHRARIYINKNIQTIQALQDRVAHVFGINNFHLTSHNEFLPPSEDVRVLQNDEVLWAMPSSQDQILEQSPPEVETVDHSQPRTKLNSSGDVSRSDKPKKRKKSQPLMEDNMIEDPDAEPLIKKKKKKKEKHRRRSVEEVISMDTSDVTLMAGTEESETGSKSEVYEKTSPSISFGGSSSSAPLSYKKNRMVPLITDQYLKQKKVNIVKIDFVAGSLDSLKELKLKEIKKLGNVCTGVDPETEQKQCVDPSESVGDEEIVDVSSSNSKENTLTSESNLKIDVGNWKQNGCDKASEPVSSDELKKKPPKTLPKPKFFKTPNFWKTRVNSSRVQIPFEEIPVIQIITATASNESENVDKLVSEEKPKVVTEIPFAETAQNVEPEPEQIPKLSIATEASPACSSYVGISSAAEEETLQSSFEISEIPLNRSEAVPSEMGKTENGSLEISGVHRIHTGGSLKPFKKISGVGTLLEGLRASTSTTSLDTTCETDTSEFVTRRVRKRSRKRQKKSLDSTYYTNRATETYHQPRPMNVKGSPAIHIKFSEDEQICDATEAPFESEGSKCISLNGSKTVLIESENDEVRVKEKDIFNSPLMTNLLPKAGDVIAFKVLKLSDDYMPEMSTHVIAKVLTFNGGSKCVSLEILGGLDQCQDPEGKFSMDLDSYEMTKSRNRVYLWTDLIEPRLIFP